MGTSGGEQFLPSRNLATVSALAKGYNDYKKRLTEEEMAKQAQRAELLKIIMPEYQRMQREQAAFQRERPFKQAGLQLQQQELAQKGQLGIAGLQVQMAGLENAWNIANMQEMGQTERDDARNQLDIQLKNIDLQIQGMMEQNKAAIAGKEITSREKISTEAVAGRKDVAQINIAADKEMAQWDNATKKYIADLNKEIAEKKLPAALSKQVDLQKDSAQLLLLAWGMADKDPANNTEIYNIIRDNYIAKDDALNTALEGFGGVSVESTPLPPLITETTGGFLGIGEKTRAVPAVVPGVVGTGHQMALPPTRGGSAATGLQVQPSQLPALRTGGVEFQRFVNMMIEQNATSISPEQKQQLAEMGIDPDAVERAAQEAARTK